MEDLNECLDSVVALRNTKKAYIDDFMAGEVVQKRTQNTLCGRSALLR